MGGIEVSTGILWVSWLKVIEFVAAAYTIVKQIEKFVGTVEEGLKAELDGLLTRMDGLLRSLKNASLSWEPSIINSITRL